MYGAHALLRLSDYLKYIGLYKVLNFGKMGLSSYSCLEANIKQLHSSGIH